MNYGDPGGNGVADVYTSPVLSGRGTYRIWIGGGFGATIGVYTLYIGCTLRDGTEINPGDAPVLDTAPAEPPQSEPAVPSFSGFGFPGLPSVDFGNMVRTSLQPGSTTNGEIPPAWDGVLGYTLTLNAGDRVELNFGRFSGNLNLGVVMLSQEGFVIFQASLITTETFTTQFPVLLPGEYTIGIYSIELSPPPTPEATSFAISVTVLQ